MTIRSLFLAVGREERKRGRRDVKEGERERERDRERRRRRRNRKRER